MNLVKTSLGYVLKWFGIIAAAGINILSEISDGVSALKVSLIIIGVVAMAAIAKKSK